MAEYFQDLCGRVRSLDPDEVFAYNTIKVVKVKDRYLGIMRLLMLLGIFLYIVVYVLIVQKKYLQTEVPVGTIYTTLLKPSTTTYIWQYPYCSKYNGSKPVHYQKDCVVWDEQQVLFPADEPNSMLLTTRTYQSYQYAQCSDLMQGCARPYSSPKVKPPVSFVADIEEFTIMCEHSFQAREFYLQTHNEDYSASSGQLSGKLVDSDGNILQHFSEGRDIISVGTFLKAANIQLDAPSTSENANQTLGESIRSAGIVLIVYIAYDNGGSGKANYVYNVAAIPSSEYKTVESIYINETTRLSVDRHGIKLVFMTVGTIGRFDFQTALIQLVSAVGLLSVSTVVVELFMLYIMPHRRFYNKYKYEETVDFSDVRDAEHETAADDRFTASLHSDLAELRRQQLLDPSM